MAKTSTRTQNIQNSEKIRDERTFCEEIQHDQEMLQKILSRPEDFLKSKGKTIEQLTPKEKKEYELEKNTAEFLKRTLVAAETTGIEMTGPDGEKIDTSKNNLPLSTYLMHGARFKFEIPAGTGHEFGNYIFNGTFDKNTPPQSVNGGNISTTIDSEKAQGKGKNIFSRIIATHGSTVSKDGTVVEKKGIGAGLKDMGCHFGMNVGAGGYGEKDIHGRDISLNGLSGHVYIYYKAPTKDKPGCMMVGMEGCVPPTIKQVVTKKSPEGQFDSHDVHGSADNFTTIGSRPAGAKFNPKTGEMELGQLDGRLEREKQVYKENGLEHPYKDTKIPQRYDGMSAKVTPQVLAQLKQVRDIPVDIGNALPKPKGNPGEIRIEEEVQKDTLDKETLNKGCKVLEQKEAERVAQKIAEKAAEKPSLGQKIKNFFKNLVGKKEEKKVEVGKPTDVQHVKGTTRLDVEGAIDHSRGKEVKGVEVTQKEGQVPVVTVDRRGKTPDARLGRAAGDRAKKIGEDPKEASQKARESFGEVVGGLQSGRVSDHEVSNSSLPSKEKPKTVGLE